MLTVTYDSPLIACRLCQSRDISWYHRDYRNNNIYKCGNCGVQFMNPQYDDRYLEQYYAAYTQEEPKWDEALYYGHSFYLSLIEQYISKGKLLDFGAGKGILVKAAHDRGWNAMGYDVDCQAMNQVGEKLGIKMFCGDFNKIDFEPKSFDVVTLHQVLEHLKSPRAYLETITSILRDGGILFLACPNIRSFSSTLKFFLEKLGIRKRKVGSYYDTDHHLWYFTHSTLSRLLRDFNYEILDIRSGHQCRPRQSRLVRFWMRNITERFVWKSSFLMILRKLKQ